ncbi:hypothetical protein Moror_4208 [Moniliophthora roreri MCA 2997]|uniref:Uncharacterized protein n=1 Tax=Moniliophthora roreri (strain MCA 2997) TaxID=1381753 RepID=V2YG36_MONRO|nr:hypothetical protein Moror_4208 [Moniliophthora roreri MCA 2997]
MSISNSTIRMGNGSTLNNVGRDQFNHIIQRITARIVIISGTTGTVSPAEDEEYNEFESIKRGDICITRKICSGEARDYEWDETQQSLKETARAQRTVYTVQIHGKAAMKFTALFYEGQGARKLWKRDLLNCRRRDIHIAQLFELIPVSHIIRRATFWDSLSLHFCREVQNVQEYPISGHFGPIQRLWLDTGTGFLCYEPGVDTSKKVAELTPCSFTFDVDCSRIPATMDMLKGDTGVRFFARQDHHFDRLVVNYADFLGDHLALSYSSKLAELRFDTIYTHSGVEIARYPSYDIGFDASLCTGLINETKIKGSGLTRFTLQATDHGQSWLAQARRIINALSAPSRQGGYFMLHPPSIHLKTVSFDLIKPLRTTYLFVYPLPYPLTTESLLAWRRGRTHFWSFDESGRSEVPKDERQGIPRLIGHVRFGMEKVVWPPYVYNAIHDWQIARGFDSNSTDFALSLGYPELEILQKESKQNSF